MKAKKSYGQHFLVNQSLIDKIVSEIKRYSGKLPILEVGPGRGALTAQLCELEQFSAVEADPDMIEYLRQHFPKTDGKVIGADFVKWRLKESISQETSLVGNFPYNISTQIVFKLLEHVELFPVMVGMFQKEVSDRIISGPGTKVYGILSVLTAHLYTGKTIIKVAPGSFSPPPKVQSSIIVLERKDDWQQQVDLYRPLKTVVKMAFNQRRKMLRSSLKSLDVLSFLAEAGLDDKRPEQLDLENFRDIARYYSGMNASKNSSSSS